MTTIPNLKAVSPALWLCTLGLGGCASAQKPPTIAYDDTPKAALLAQDPPMPVQVVEIAKPLPLPGQLMPIPTIHPVAAEPSDPRAQVAAANQAARIQPSRSGYINAVQVYPFSDGALYQVYAAPGEITDVILQAGESLVGAGAVAAGDTVRWVIGDTESGTGATKRIHILIKPTAADLTTNAVLNTDRRTYHLELHATPRTYMASVSWQYPQDELIALRQQNQTARTAASIAAGVDVDALNFRYRIEGDSPPWRPLRAFDDGRQVIISFPAAISQGEMPPLFVIGPSGKTSDLVNYRVHGASMIVDRLFAAAELRMGDKGSQQRVRIVRTDGRPQ